MNYKIKLEIVNEDTDEVIIQDNTFVSLDNITSAEDSFYRLLRNFEKQLKKEQLIGEDAEEYLAELAERELIRRRLLDEVVDKEIKEIKEND